MKTILVTGATGQIGSELVPELRAHHGVTNVIAMAHTTEPTPGLREGPLEFGDVTDRHSLQRIMLTYNVGTIYHLASLLSARGECEPDLAWEVNMVGLKNVLDLARDFGVERVFWPSSIAVFGPSTPRDNTPQATILEPTTMYGITKVAGELLCMYYWGKYGMDVRSLRYPGLISHRTPPGGGTTDYAVAIFHAALAGERYRCFVRDDTALPMMYMPDAIRGTIDFMRAEPESITVRTSYNFSALSFTARELAEEISRHVPDFSCDYEPDFRQTIADSWPKSMDDSVARADWGWEHGYGLSEMAADMLANLRAKMR